MLAQILEVIMMVAFGCSWPLNIAKAWKARTARGTSIWFLLLIELGYACGIAGKVIGDNITYVVFFYGLNFVLVLGAIFVYIRNKLIDRREMRRGPGGLAPMPGQGPAPVPEQGFAPDGGMEHGNEQPPRP